MNDELWGILVTYEIAQAFINFGNSSVLALGSHPYEENWPLGINNPYHSGKIEGEIDLIDNTMPTTGNKPQHTAHIINPFTGAYSKDRRIISIIAKNAIDAEALSTTMIVAGKEVALAILSHFSIDNRLVFNL